LYGVKGEEKKKKSPHWKCLIPGVGARSLLTSCKNHTAFLFCTEKRKNYTPECREKTNFSSSLEELNTFTPVVGWMCFPKSID